MGKSTKAGGGGNSETVPSGADGSFEFDQRQKTQKNAFQLKWISFMGEGVRWLLSERHFSEESASNRKWPPNQNATRIGQMIFVQSGI